MLSQTFISFLQINIFPSWVIYISCLYFLFGVITAILLLIGIKASYGRYNSGALFPSLVLNPRLSWMFQESPSLLIPLYLIITRYGEYDFYNFIVTMLFVTHYFQRSIIYPLLMKSKNLVPIEIVLSAFLFCTINGFLQGYSHLLYIKYQSNTFSTVTSWIGFIIFALGMFINIQADHILRNLRKEGETDYKIPVGGVFDYVTCANYFGEIIEWFGFFLVAKSLPSLVFMFFTITNIGPRAIQHHQWYLEKFDNYPKNRKVLIPFVF
uniref:3-oxo-5alpha-steroid 4-dehydrogenase (NADP(+)) n=2 Tax=Parastrongyloides trichosuri TaxID=131310 RepID=A0A0N5A6Q2_PARTI